MLATRRMRFLFVAVLIATIYTNLASAQDSPEAAQAELRATQEKIACQLSRNITFADAFKSSVRERHGVDPNFLDSTYRIRLAEHFSQNIRCRESCSGDVTWCVNIYHPSEDIEMCLNQTSEEINATSYALHLGLDDFFTLSSSNSRLRINAPPYFLSDSILTCTVQSADCLSRTFHAVDVQRGAEVSQRPHVTIHNSSELILGERNVILCTAEFKYQQQDLRPQKASCVWYMNNTSSDVKVPLCDPFDNDNTMDCFDGIERVRFYTVDYHRSDCPLRTFILSSWMVIDNATEADTELMYECRAGYIASNPTEHYLSMTATYIPVPVYPLIDVITLETPSLPPDHIDNDSIPTYDLNADESLQWTCSVQAGVGDTLLWMYNGIELPSLDVILEENEQQNISCMLPLSSNVFVVSHEAVEVDEFEMQFTSTLFLCRVTELTSGLYECVVNRSRGERWNEKLWSAMVISATSTLTTEPQPSDDSVASFIIGVSVGVGTALLLLVIAAFFLVCCSCIRKRKRQRKSDWTRDIFVTDDDVLHISSTNSACKLKGKSNSMPLQAVDPFEFPRNKLVFLNTVLGEGTFGIVLQAKAEHIVKSAPHRNIVAVKTPREKAPPHDIDNFWEELNLMKSILPHKNVINLLGHCTTPGGPLYMIIEYARYGSLKDFLKECEDVVLQLNHVPQTLHYYRHHHSSSTYSPSSTCSAYPQLLDKTQFSTHSASGGAFSPVTTTPSTAGTSGMFEFPPTKPSGLTRERLTTQDSGFYGETVDCLPQATFNDVLDGVPMAHSVSPLTHDYVNSKGLLYMEDVQNFALQIACGLKHLEDIQIVHCDLAARNILIAEGFVLKIGDFGMARDVSEKEYYRKQGGRIPVKWTAPEALKDHIFSFKSDIWSFGLVLWEILTYGQRPYHKIKIHHSWEPFINYLMEGNRLPQPKGCPDILYDLMQSCWHTSPNHRPTANQLVQFLSQKNIVETSETTFIQSTPPNSKKTVTSLVSS